MQDNLSIVIYFAPLVLHNLFLPYRRRCHGLDYFAPSVLQIAFYLTCGVAARLLYPARELIRPSVLSFAKTKGASKRYEQSKTFRYTADG